MLYKSLTVFLFSIALVLPLHLTERRVVRSVQPMRLKLQGQTPARFALDILAHRNLPRSSAKVYHEIDLNIELDKIKNKKPPLYRLQPMKVSLESQHPYGKAKILVGAKQKTGEWKSRSLEFSGPLELSGDTALGPGRQLEIRWRGEKASESLSGNISVGWDKSEYNLKLPYLGGEIIAQLKDDSGDIIGEGRVPVTQTVVSSRALSQPIRIRPVRKPMGFRDFNAIAAGNKDRGRMAPRIELAHVHPDVAIDEDYGFLTKALVPGSSTLARAHHEGYVSMTSLVSDHYSQEIPMLSTKAENNYKLWLQELMGEKVETLHIGKVINQGKPQSGVAIEVESKRYNRVFYLNDFFIPDSELLATSENGYFFIVNLEPGFYNLSIKGLGQVLAYSQFLVDNQGLSAGDHLIGFNRQETTVRVFDFFNQLEQPASLFSFTSPVSAAIEGEGPIEVEYNSIGQGYLAVVPEVEGYLKVTVHQQIEHKRVNVPLIPALWFNEFLIMNRVTFNEDAAFVIGFFESEITAIETPLLEQTDALIYFDESGVQCDSPVVGGGYIVTGIPPNSPQLIIFETPQGNKISKLFSVEPGETLQINLGLLD